MKLLYIKRCDAFNNATLGTHLGVEHLFQWYQIYHMVFMVL